VQNLKETNVRKLYKSSAPRGIGKSSSRRTKTPTHIKPTAKRAYDLGSVKLIIENDTDMEIKGSYTILGGDGKSTLFKLAQKSARGDKIIRAIPSRARVRIVLDVFDKDLDEDSGLSRNIVTAVIHNFEAVHSSSRFLVSHLILSAPKFSGRSPEEIRYWQYFKSRDEKFKSLAQSSPDECARRVHKFETMNMPVYLRSISYERSNPFKHIKLSYTPEKEKVVKEMVEKYCSRSNQNDIDIPKVVEKLWRLTVDRKKDLYRQRDKGEYIYVVDEGTFGRYKMEIEGEGEIRIGAFHPGDVFGFEGDRRCSIRCETYGTVWVISIANWKLCKKQKDFIPLEHQTQPRWNTQKSPQELEMISKILKDNPVTKTIETQSILDVMWKIEAKAGDIVCQEYHPGTQMYIVGNGKFGVYTNGPNGEERIGEVIPGGSFGCSLLQINVNEYSIKCETDKGSLWAIDINSFFRVKESLGKGLSLKGFVVIEGVLEERVEEPLISKTSTGGFRYESFYYRIMVEGKKKYFLNCWSLSKSHSESKPDRQFLISSNGVSLSVRSLSEIEGKRDFFVSFPDNKIYLRARTSILAQQWCKAFLAALELSYQPDLSLRENSILFVQIDRIKELKSGLEEELMLSISTTFSDFTHTTKPVRPHNPIWNELIKIPIEKMDEADTNELIFKLSQGGKTECGISNIDIYDLVKDQESEGWYRLKAPKDRQSDLFGRKGKQKKKKKSKNVRTASLRVRLLLAKSIRDAEERILGWNGVTFQDIKLVSQHKVKWKRSRLTIVGKGRSGKTTLLRALRGMEFVKTDSTLMADVAELNIQRVDLDVKDLAKGAAFQDSDPGDHARLLAAGIRALKQTGSSQSNTNPTEDTKAPPANPEIEESKYPSAYMSVGALQEVATPKPDPVGPMGSEANMGSEEKMDSEANLDSEVKMDPEEMLGSEEERVISDGLMPEPIARELDLLMFNTGLQENGTRVSVWDFAGQEVYYTAHQIFLVRNSLYVVTFSLDRWFQESSKNEEERFLIFWLESIRTNACGAKFLVVGTHIDVLLENLNSKQDMDEAVMECTERLMDIIDNVFGETRYFIPSTYELDDGDKIEICFFPVDSKTRLTTGECDESVLKVRDAIAKSFTNDPNANQKVPVSWSAVCDELIMHRDNHWMTLESIKSICTHHDIHDPREIGQMLQKFHDLGVNIYFDEYGLRDYVILKPQFLLNIVKHIIYDPKVHKKIHRKTLTKTKDTRNKVAHLFQKGILHIEMLDLLWDKTCIPGKPEDRKRHLKFILNLLQKYMLLCPCHSEKEEYVVPSMLKKSQTDQRIISRKSDRKNRESSLKSPKTNSNATSENVFCIAFKRFRPRGFFHMLLARLIYTLHDPKTLTMLPSSDYKVFKIDQQILYQSYAEFRLGPVSFAIEGPTSLSNESDRQEGNISEKCIFVRVKSSKEHCAAILNTIQEMAKAIFDWPFRGQVEFEFRIWQSDHPIDSPWTTLKSFWNGLKRINPLLSLQDTSQQEEKIEVHISKFWHWNELSWAFANHVTLQAKLQTIFTKVSKGASFISSKDAVSLCGLLQMTFPKIGKIQESVLCNELRATSNKGRIEFVDFVHFMWIKRPLHLTQLKTLHEMNRQLDLWVLRMEKPSERAKVGRIPVYTHEELKRVKCLGEGNFGSAYLVQLPDGSQAVLKVERQKQSIDSHELQAMFKLKPHSNLLKLMGMVTINDNLCIITELCELGSLDKLHHKVKMDDDEGLIPIAKHIVSGLRALHRSGIVHRDLACRNLFMKEGGKVVIADYGLARSISETKEYYISKEAQMLPILWMAPECIFKGRFSYRGDIWSLGVTIWELLSKGVRPYDSSLKEGLSTHEITKQVQSGTLALLPDTNYPSNQDKSIVLARKCLQLDVKKRPDADDLATDLGVEDEKEDTKTISDIEYADIEYDECEKVRSGETPEAIVEVSLSEAAEMNISSPEGGIYYDAVPAELNQKPEIHSMNKEANSINKDRLPK